MAKGKKTLEVSFPGLGDLTRRLNALGGNIEEAAENALIKSKKKITNDLRKAMDKSHYDYDRTGNTKGSLDENMAVNWDNGVATIDVGFDIENGGLASVFLMYGTPHHAPNHPGIKRDSPVFTALFGKNAQKSVWDIQRTEFQKILREAELKK